MTSSMQQIVQHTMPPELGGTPLRPLVDELMGVPYSNPHYSIEGGDEQTHFVESTAQLLFGRNKTNLGELIVVQQLLRDNFYTSTLAPIQVMGPNETLTVQMDQITFHPILPQITPEEGRSRIASWEYNSETQTLNRQALSAEFGHEFLYDPKGQMIARKVMDQLNNGIEEGQKFGVMWAYAHVPDQAIARDLEKSSKLLAQWGSRAIDSFFARTKRYFGIFQAEEKAHIIIENLLKEEMGEYGGEADSYLVPFALIHYVTVINPLFTEFMRGGERAVQTLERGTAAFGKWGTSNVYICRAYDTDRARGPVDLLRRRFVYSEYYVMWDHLRAHYGSYEGYQTSWRSVQIMDADRDARAIVTLREALLASGRWDSNGKLIAIDDPMMNDYDVPLNPDEQRDTFHYTDKNGNQRPAEFWGQIPSPYLSTRTLLSMAERALGSTHIDAKKLSGAIRVIQDAIVLMRRIPYDSYLDDYLALIAQVNKDGRRGEKHDRRTGCPTINTELLDWIPNQFGGMNLPELLAGDASEFDQPQPARAAYAEGDAAARTNALLAALRAFTGNPTDNATFSATDANGNVAISHPDYPKGSLRATDQNRVVTLIFNPFKRISGRFPLPPLFASGPGFRFIHSMARSSSNRAEFMARYGEYNFEMAVKIADAVDTVTEAIEPLHTRMPNAPLLDRNYTSSHFHNADEFTLLVENLIGQGGVPLFLRRTTTTRSGSDREGASVIAPAAGAPARRPLNVVDFERAVEGLTGTTSAATDMIQNTLTGKLSTLRNVLGRYATQLAGTGAVAGPTNEVTIPAVAAVSANINAAPSANNNPVGVVFDPFQNGAAAPVFSTNFDDVRSNLPLLARRRFGNAAATPEAVNIVTVPRDGDPRDARSLFGYNANLAAGPAVGTVTGEAIKEVYNKLARYLFNYRIRVNETIVFDQAFADRYARAEGARLAVLSLITMVNQNGAKRTDREDAIVGAVVQRLASLFTNLLEPIGARPQDNDITEPNVNPQNLIAAVRQFLARPETAALGVFDAARTEQVITDTINFSFQKAAEVGQQLKDLIQSRGNLGGAPAQAGNEASAQARRRAAIRTDPADYMRTSLVGSDVQFRTHYEYVTGGDLGFQRVPMALFADPEDTEVVVSQLRQQQLSIAIAEGQPVPPTLAPSLKHTRNTNPDQLQASANVRTLRGAYLLAPLNDSAVNPAAYEAEARRSENYAGKVNYRSGPTAPNPLVSTSAAGAQNFWGAFSGGVQVASSLRDDSADESAMRTDGVSYQAPTTRGVTSSLRCISLANVRNNIDSAFSVSSFQQHWDEIERESAVDPAKALVAKIIAATPTDWRNVEAFLDGHIPIPVTPVLVRPLIVFNTYTIYKVKAGSDTAITFIARPMTNWGNNADRQVFQLQMSYYSKTIVRNKKNVQALPNVFICGLERGMNMSFFTRRSFREVNNAVTNSADSIISLLEPYDPYLEKQLPSVFPLTGKFAFAQFSFADDPARDNRLCYFNVAWANRYWGFYHRSKQEITREADRLSAAGSNPRFEFYTHGGQVLHYNPREGKFTYKRSAVGYIPDKFYGPGMVRVWKDSTQAYPPQNFGNMTDI